MKAIYTFLLISCSLVITHTASGQIAKKDSAEFLYGKALIKQEAGKADEAIALIKQAQRLDPKNIAYDYELAFIYHSKKDFAKTVELLEKLVMRKDANGKIYHLMGNTYDEMNQPAKAIETYKAGLVRFPNAGELYYEQGIMSLRKKDYSEAINFFEKGIEMDPNYPTNYYRAAKMFLNSAEKVWGMLYAELYILLDPFSERSKEMSKLLYEAYVKQVAIAPMGQVKVFFANRVIPDSLAMNDSLAKKTQFAKTVYEPLLVQGLKRETAVDPLSLNRARKSFIENYFKSDAWKLFPNALFDYQYKLFKSGKMDIYNYWILQQYNTTEFSKWQEVNQPEYREMVKWMVDHPMNLDTKYKFYRGQYR